MSSRGTTSAIVPARPSARFRADRFGRYPSSSMAASTRSRVAGRTTLRWWTTFVTVLSDTPARSATSRSVTRPTRTSGLPSREHATVAPRSAERGLRLGHDRRGRRRRVGLAERHLLVRAREDAHDLAVADRPGGRRRAHAVGELLDVGDRPAGCGVGLGTEQVAPPATAARPG